MILKKTDNHVDIASIIPGKRLIDMINYTIKYCQENDVTATLEFNGAKRQVDKFSDSEFISKIWFDWNFNEKVKQHKVQLRDAKIESILR